MDWEQTKENCVPVRQGRSKAALQELADSASEALEAKRRELWTEVVEYKGDDPLDAWQRYIKWMQEYGVGGGKADLLKVLEACTKALLQHPRYANDIRFLRIWIQYADCLPDPGDVLLFLKEKGIGHGFALYYEAYATYFELRGNFQTADAVYTDGVQRGAKPLDRLKQKHLAFQQRMAQRVQRSIQDEHVPGPPPSEPVRSSLSTVGQRAAGRRPHGQQSQSLFGAEGPQSNTLLFGTHAGQQDQQRGPRPAIDLLADGDPENGILSLPGYSSMPQVNNLRELKPYGVVRKENLDRPVAWNQAGGQSGGGQSAGGAAGGIAIFTDEEFQDGSEEAPGVQVTGRATVPGPAAAASHPLLLGAGAPRSPSGMDALMSSLAPPPILLRGMQPGLPPPALHTFAGLTRPRDGIVPAHGARRDARTCDADAADLHESRGRLPASSSRRPEAASGPVAALAPVAQPPAAVKTPKAERVHGDALSAPGPGSEDEETSYEELRAAAWFRRNPAVMPTVSGAPITSRCAGGAGACGQSSDTQGLGSSGARCPALDSEKPRRADGPDPGQGPSARPLAPRASVGGSTAQQAGLVVDNIAQAAIRRVPFGQMAVPDGSSAIAMAPENAHTSTNQAVDRSCSAAGAGLFAQRPALGNTPPAPGDPLAPQTGPACSAAAAPRHVPLASAVTSGCGGPMPHNAGASSSHDDLQPTVTISTRSAFDLMNSLFSEDLPHQQRRSQAADRSVLGGAEAGRSRPALSQLGVLDARPGSSALASAQHLAVEAVAPPLSKQQPAPAPAAAASASAEPTVTLNTRLAFDALNDMFSDSLPHEEARKLARRAGADGVCKSMTSSDVCRLANAGRAAGLAQPRPSTRGAAAFSSAYSGGTLGSAAVGPNPNAVSVATSLAIHEDTFFLGPAPPAVPGERGGVGGSAAAFRGPQDAGVSGIYEDTEFMPRGPSARPGQGVAALAAAPGERGAGGPVAAGRRSQGASALGIYEDTEFMPRGPSARPGQGFAGADILPGGALILEDTEFITRPQEGFASAPAATAIERRAHADSAASRSSAAEGLHSRMQAYTLEKSDVLGRPGGPGPARDAGVGRTGSSTVRLTGVGASLPNREVDWGALQVYEDGQ